MKIVCFQSLIFKEDHDVYLMRLAVCIVSCIIFNCAQVLIKFILTIEIENEEVRNSNPMKG